MRLSVLRLCISLIFCIFGTFEASALDPVEKKDLAGFKGQALEEIGGIVARPHAWENTYDPTAATNYQGTYTEIPYHLINIDCDPTTASGDETCLKEFER